MISVTSASVSPRNPQHSGIALRQLSVCAVILSVAFGSRAVRGQPIPEVRDSRLNVLLVAIDDLRPELGCYGADQIHSPNIDAFAASGLLFERAYCQQALCNPSRTSLLTGLRPHTTGVTHNHIHFRTNNPHVLTLPQYFKLDGYHSEAIGKIYHGFLPEGASKTSWDTLGDPQSWSVPAKRFGPRYYYTEEGIDQAQLAYRQMYQPKDPKDDDWTKYLVFGPMTESPDVADNTLIDGQCADAAIESLQRLAARGDAADPFFLAVGFIKPHTPFVAPKKYWDLYNADDIKLAERQELPNGAPSIAGHNSGEVRRYTDQPKQQEPFTSENQRRLRHGYYACVSYIDAQVGRVLDELDRLKLADDTVVVLFGDHGWHLGEHGLWGKTTNFELDTRVPLIIRVPGRKTAGKRTRSLVEFVDLYPTLADMAGLKVPDELDGVSLRPVLADETATVKDFALSQYPRGERMGYSIRSDNWRYTVWREDPTGLVTGEELYDHRTTDEETNNVAFQGGFREEKVRLSTALDEIIPLPSVRAGRSESASRETHESVSATGFETLEAGELLAQQNAAGSWSAATGHATVHTGHHRSGRQCLRLLGGEAHQVVWTPAIADEPAEALDLWFERWTRREPFDFHIEALIDEKWKTLHHDTKLAVVGSFKNHLSLPLVGRPSKIRFTSTTPQNSGVMIDDVRLVKSGPMRVTDIDSVQPAVPVLIRSKFNPVLEIAIEVEGSDAPQSFTGMRIDFAGTSDFADIDHVELFCLDSDEDFSSLRSDSWATAAKRFGSPQPPDTVVRFSNGTRKLTQGTNHFVVSVTLKDTADFSNRIVAELRSVQFSPARFIDRSQVDTHILKSLPGPHSQRIGCAVRKADDDGAKAFRIPGLATTNNGTLIGVYDIRHRGWGDLPGDIDVGMSRSTDGGQSWEPMQTIMDMGDDPKWNFDGVGDPSVLVDRNTGTIWVAGTWSHGNRSWRGSGPGLEPDETGQFMLVRSDDDGRTWSKPINITKQVKKPEWCFILQGPGSGITMQDGTLVFPAQYQDPPEQNRMPHSTIIWSKDHGDTWHVGTGAFDDTTESAVAEIEPGVLMLNCRYDKQNRRVVMTTHDSGQTWTEHVTSRKSLPEPGACMGSLLRVPSTIVDPAASLLPRIGGEGARRADEGATAHPSTASNASAENVPTAAPHPAFGHPLPEAALVSNPRRDRGEGKNSVPGRARMRNGAVQDRADNNWLLFSNPNVDAGPRRRITIKASNDNGVTWPTHWHTLIDEDSSAGYSCLTMVDDQHVGILYEGSRAHMTFVKIPLAELTHVPDEFRSGMAPGPKTAGLTLAPVFQDHMVLQRDVPIRVWGTSKPSCRVTAEFGSLREETITDAAGKWQIEFPPQPANARGQSLRVTCGRLITINDILIGEVWIAAGQSNMEWPLSKSDGAEGVIAESSDPQLRLLRLQGAARGGSGEYTNLQLARMLPDRFCRGEWLRSMPESSREFSAVAYHFGRQLRAELDVPVGIICPAIGGTPTEAWTRRAALAEHHDLSTLVDGNWMENDAIGSWCRERAASNLSCAMADGDYIPGDDLGPNHSFKPGFMWDAAMKPMRHFPIRGVIWYQGESNADSPERVAQHEQLFPLLVRDWRDQWGIGEFPFLYVQLPELNRPDWPEFRDSQQRMLSVIPNSGMVVTLDVGHPTDVHPTNKKPVGERLAAQAMSIAYGDSGPTP